MGVPTVKMVEYLDTAKARGNFDSDTRLSIAIGQGPTWASVIRRGIAMPSEEAMLRLAELAGVSPDIALLDLHRERARDPRIKSLWANILQRVAVCIVLATLAVVPGARAAQFTQGENSPLQGMTSVYYQKRRARFRAEFCRYLDLIFPSPHPT
jgi:hypothetical protein